MKKYFIIALAAALLLSVPVFAQSSNSYKLDLPEVAAADPYTTLTVTLTVEKEAVKKGPYARFAQKYLGSVAALNDKEIYTIKDASISYIAPERPIPPMFRSVMDEADMASGGSSPKVDIDRMSSIEKSSEDMARDAASMIFTIRKRRFDLISGEAGENVFGDGLRAALQELDRMESEYTALFLGTRSVELQTKTFEVIPQTGRTNYIVCRFKADAGILPESDLSGAPIALVLTPENGIQAPAASKGARDYYRVADFVQCTLSGASGEIAKARIPIFQFGQTVAAASR